MKFLLQAGTSGENSNIAFLIILHIIVISAAVAALVVLYRKKRLKYEEKLYTDRITGGINFSKFEISSAELLSHRTVNYAIVSLSIKNYRHYLETFGSEAGEWLILSVYTILKESLIPGELLARREDDRMVAMLQYTGMEQFADRANQMLFKISKLSSQEGIFSSVTVRIGASVLGKNDMDIVDSFEKAIYAGDKTKLTGASSFTFYNDHFHEMLENENELSNDMHEAFKDGDFDVFYQPRVSIASRNVAGAEALIRWQHSKKGLLSPSEFIPYFEKSGFIVKIDMWVFEEACKQLSLWRENGDDIVPVSSNFSGRHFTDIDFPEKLLQIAQKYDIPPYLLEIEFSEESIINSMELAKSQIAAIKSRGFTVTVDCFGSEYAAVSIIKDFAIDIIKIDKSFVSRSSYNKYDKAMISGIVHLINDLNKTAVCEGVETLEQINLLREIGCGIAQGFYYSKPLRCDDFIAFDKSLESIRNES